MGQGLGGQFYVKSWANSNVMLTEFERNIFTNFALYKKNVLMV